MSKTIISIITTILCLLPMQHTEAQTLMQDSLTKDTILHNAAVTEAAMPAVTEGNAMPTVTDSTAQPSFFEEEANDILKAARKHVKRDWATWKPDPKRAMWLAIMIPGAGQIYNRKFWKLPIVYGGFVGCAYAMRWNNQMYLDYSQAYLDIMDDDPNTQSYSSFLHLGAAITDANIERYKKIFKSRKDRYRRWRDLSFVCLMGVYAISIIDAYVDASLSQFDISDDLSLRLSPAVINGNTFTDKGLQTSGLGMNAALTF